MRSLLVLSGIAMLSVASAQFQKPELARPDLAATPAARTQMSVTLLVPVQLRNIPSDIDNVTVRCLINAPYRHWESSAPVHLGAGRFDGTIAVKFNLPQYLPYDANYGCSLQLSNSVLDVLENIRRSTPDPAFPKVLTVNGSFPQRG